MITMSESNRRAQKIKELTHVLEDARIRGENARKEIQQLQAEEFIKFMEEMPLQLTAEEQFDVLAKAVAEMWASRRDHVPLSIHTLVIRVQQAGVDLEPYLKLAAMEKHDG